jgi:hypothetical protein
MTDLKTHEPLRVSTDSVGGPYLDVPLDQLADVRRLLDAHGVYYWVSQLAISINQSAKRIYVYFGRKGDADTVQRILDAG